MNNNIDEYLVKTIDILNQKGYITKYSCQGHVDSNIPNTYINFEDLLMSKKMKVYKKVRLPKGFYFESTDTIRKIYDDNVTEDEIKKSCMALERWANRLPDIKFVESNYEFNVLK